MGWLGVERRGEKRRGEKRGETKGVMGVGYVDTLAYGEIERLRVALHAIDGGDMKLARFVW